MPVSTVSSEKVMPLGKRPAHPGRAATDAGAITSPLGQGRRRTRTMPRYSLRKGLGVWQLLFDGEEALLQHEQGIHYVAWLLRHPAGMPLHGLELAAKAAQARARSNIRAAAGVAEDAAGLQRNLGMDDAEAARALWRKRRG